MNDNNPLFIFQRDDGEYVAIFRNKIDGIEYIPDSKIIRVNGNNLKTTKTFQELCIFLSDYQWSSGVVHVS